MTRHLIHVGYPKAGSTFLQEWFEQHPELHYAPGGIAGFRDVHQMCHVPGTRYRYHVTSSEGLSTPHPSTGSIRRPAPGQASPPLDRFKEKQAEVCELLRSLYPGSLVLIVTRGFKGIVLSGYSQFVRSGGTLHPEPMCRSLAEQLGGEDPQYYDFDYLIGLYAEAFGEDNVIVLPYELLRDDQARFLEVLEGRLGVGHVDVEMGRVNPSLSPEELYWYPLISRTVFAAGARLPRRLRERVFQAYVTRAFNARLRPLVSVLGRVKRGRRISWDDFPAGLLQHFRGRATRLRGDPLYAPYAAEYLWDEEGAGG